MADKQYTDITFLLDRSGSMGAIRRATINGFEAFMEEQRAVEGRCLVSLSQFDDQYEEVYTEQDAKSAPPLTLEPRRGTALLDAIAKAVTSTAARLAAKPEEERPGAVIIGIMTDGMENSSVEYTHAMIKELITRQEQEHGWTFFYMGANQDAIEVGGWLGIAEGRSLSYSYESTAEAMRYSGSSIRRYRELMSDGSDLEEARLAASFTKRQRAEADQAGSSAEPRRRSRRSINGSSSQEVSKSDRTRAKPRVVDPNAPQLDRTLVLSPRKPEHTIGPILTTLRDKLKAASDRDEQLGLLREAIEAFRASRLKVGASNPTHDLIYKMHEYGISPDARLLAELILEGKL